MKCPVCGKENGSGVNFCEGCGRRIPRCPTCGTELTCRDRFCSNDGTRLSDELLMLVPENPTVRPAPVVSAPADDWEDEGTVLLTSHPSPAFSSPPPVRKPAPAPVVPDYDADEGTVLLTSEPVRPSRPAAPPVRKLSPAPLIPDDDEDEGTVLLSSAPVKRQAAPSVRNTDPVSRPAMARASKPAPQKAFCENCGQPCTVGSRFCTACQKELAAAKKKPKKSNGLKITLIILLILLLIGGLVAGGIALLHSDLFDWDTSSSSSSRRNNDDEDEDEDEDEDGDVAAVEDPDVPSADAVLEVPAESVEGVEDPVYTLPEEETVASETTAPATEPPTEVEEDPLMYWIENCDKMYLSAKDLEGFDAQMCVYARNACYAKSGRKFNSSALQEYFSQFDWYNPTISPNNFSNSMLNTYQTANINVVLEYERAHGYNQ